MLRSAFISALVAGAVTAGSISAQAPPTLPSHYALTGVRIVPSPGRVIENGTVILRDGRIVAAGAQVPVPAGAIRMDLAGHTVYAGLIDAATSFGLPSVTRSGQGGQGGAQPEPTEVVPDRDAASVFDPAEADLARVRNAGITTLGLTFDGGIFPGRVSAVHTGDNEERVLRTPVAQQVALGRRRGGYPGTLMGALAYVKQNLFDAQHDRRVRQAWERQQSGPRPAYDPEHMALEPAATGALPVWFLASSERDFGRIADLARETGVANYVMVGAQEGWRSVADLRAAGNPVIVSLDFPDAGQISGRSFENFVAPLEGAEAAEAAADSAAVRTARGNAAVLARAGIPLALSSHGMSSPAQLRERVRLAIAAGLTADDALRALTVTPARLLGLDGAIGTVEAGKLANVVVTNGDIFGENTRVTHVFVEGIRYDVPAPAPDTSARRRGAAAGSAATASPMAAFAGEWLSEIDGPGGLMEMLLTIRVEGDGLAGVLSSDMGDVQLRGEYTNGEMILRGTAARPA